MARHRERLDVQQAAEALGISTDAVRKRARRGTLDSEKTEDGYLYVWLDQEDTGTPNGTPPGAPNGLTPTQAHLDSLQEQIEFLRRELERKDHLIAALERIPPQLPSPQSAENAPQSAEDDPVGVASGPPRR